MNTCENVPPWVLMLPELNESSPVASAPFGQLALVTPPVDVSQVVTVWNAPPLFCQTIAGPLTVAFIVVGLNRHAVSPGGPAPQVESSWMRMFAVVPVFGRVRMYTLTPTTISTTTIIAYNTVLFRGFGGAAGFADCSTSFTENSLGWTLLL